MKSIIALEKIIKELEIRISNGKGLLSRHNSGEETLSLLAQSSAENNLEQNIPLLEQYRALLKELEKLEKIDSFENRRLRASVDRKKYYKYNKKEKDLKTRLNDDRIEASMIVDELPEEFVLENEELFEIATKNLKEYLIFYDDSESLLKTIQDEFNNLIKGFTEENIKNLELLNYMIPIVIFQLYIFMKNVIEEQDLDSNNSEVMSEESFFPKYHDWWISELWESHVAYFSLIKWKHDIKKKCPDIKYENVWSVLFNNFLFVKTLISEKSDLAFEYQYICDSILKKYVYLESELDKNIIENNREEIKKYIDNENLLELIPKHHVITPYIKYKISNKKHL